MLIRALCDYYDILAKAGSVLPSGYSLVKVHYLISLTEAGLIDEIIPYQDQEEIKMAKGKIKKVWMPRNAVLPQRTEKPGIDANIIEHRPLYIFGLNYDNGKFSQEDRTGKARKSHEAFAEANLAFFEGIETPLAQAFRQFILNWNPAKEIENSQLLALGKDYGKSGFVFCLSGYPDKLLHEDLAVREKWEQSCMERLGGEEKGYVAQCAVSGENTSIARIHGKIKGVYGGLATGSVLVGFNNSSENSYGKDQSYNSNISEAMMKKYTEALNYLLGKREHKILLDDVTVVFWAMSEAKDNEDVLTAMLYGQSDKMDAGQTQLMLKRLLEDGRKGKILRERLQSLEMIDPDVDFYIVGLKPNSSRLALKFIYCKKFGEILWNIARFQADMQITEEFRPVSLSRIKKELISPKSQNEKLNPALVMKLFEAVIYGGKYPQALLETAVRRIKTDTDSQVNEIRAGIVKACINRINQKEELNVALNQESKEPAYLCGRLFAVLERLQKDASGNSLNRTIKDAYFASAVSKPAMVFPKLIVLSQNHLDKVKRLVQDRSNKIRGPVFYSRLIGEIIDKLNDEFPGTLDLCSQGRFIVGYYQQYQSFFNKNECVQQEEEEKNYGN